MLSEEVEAEVPSARFEAADLKAMFDEAVQDALVGRLDSAEPMCDAILRDAEDHDGALNLKGVIAYLRGQTEPAGEFLERAVAIQPSNASYRVNFAKALAARGRVVDAERHLREAVRLDPNNTEGHLSLAEVLRSQGRLEEARSCLSFLVTVRPTDASLRAVYGSLLQDLGCSREAMVQYREACRLDPNRAEVLNNLGLLLKADGDPDEAEAQFRRALQIQPLRAEVFNNLGNLLWEQRRAVEAQDYCREALRLSPGYPMAHNNLANALKECGDYEGAEYHYREAIHLKPDYAEAHSNLAVLIGHSGRLDPAIDLYRRAIQLQPDYKEAHRNLGMTLLGAGRFEEGWQTYDTHRKAVPRPDLTGPVWDGTDLDGGVLLVHAEQGFGDAIQFCRFVPLLKGRARVAFEVPPQLAELLTHLPGVEDVIVRGASLPTYRAHCALMSLPRWLDITPEKIRGEAPYLSVDRKRVAGWRSQVEALPGLRVGLVWAGNPALANDRQRSIDPDKFGILGAISGVSFVSLQRR